MPPRISSPLHANPASASGDLSLRLLSALPISSRQNARVKQLRAAFLNPSSAPETTAIDGEHLLLEALRSHLPIPTLFLRSGNESLLRRIHDRYPIPASTEILLLADDVFASAVPAETPQGIAALCVLPRFSLPDLLSSTSAPLIVVAAALQDPGNLGTLIRSAEAFSATGLLTLPGTVHLRNHKVLRASAGSAFRLPIVSGDDASLSELSSRGLTLYAATASHSASTFPAHECDLTRPSAILIGNEGSGLPDSLLTLTGQRITISTPGPVESLNAGVAASILLYEAARQRTRHT